MSGTWGDTIPVFPVHVNLLWARLSILRMRTGDTALQFSSSFSLFHTSALHSWFKRPRPEASEKRR